MMQISQVLTKGVADLKSAQIPHPELEAEILLLAAIGQSRSREWLITNPNCPLNNETVKQFNDFFDRRKKFEPIAFITHHKEFYGYDFYVDNRVLIPRPESELLVEKALQKIEEKRKKKAQDWNAEYRKSNIDDIPYSIFHILELGTGSGCIIISIIKELKKQFAIAHARELLRTNFKFIATDISQDALAVAQKNAKTHKVNQLVQFVRSDLFASLKAKFDLISDPTYYLLPTTYSLIIANLPYVPSYWIKNGPTEYGLIHEPKISLDGGKEGLDVYQRFFKEVPKYLAKDGTILIECEDDQIEKNLKILKDLKYKFSHQVFKDYNGLQRVVQIDKIN